jgi:hypothetical protein
LDTYIFEPFVDSFGSRIVAPEDAWQALLKGLPSGTLVVVLADLFGEYHCRLRDKEGYGLRKSIIQPWIRDNDRYGGEDHVKLKMVDLVRRLFEIIDSRPDLKFGLVTSHPENIKKLVPPAAKRNNVAIYINLEI